MTTTEHAVRVARAFGFGPGEVAPLDRESDPGTIVLPLAVDGEADLILATDDDDRYDVIVEWATWSYAEGPTGHERIVANDLTIDEALRFSVWFCAAQVRANERAEREMDDPAAGDDGTDDPITHAEAHGQAEMGPSRCAGCAAAAEAEHVDVEPVESDGSVSLVDLVVGKP